jgi:hypothetical protein
MSAAENAKSPASHLHVMNLVVALLAGMISIVGGVYTLKNNFFPSQTYGGIEGIVRDEKLAKPLWLAPVEISTAEGAVVSSVTTDKEGHYLVEKLPTGSYEVKFSAPMHKSESKTVRIEKNLTASVHIDLVPEAEKMTLPAEVKRAPVASAAPQSRYPGDAAQQGAPGGSQAYPPSHSSPGAYASSGSANYGNTQDPFASQYPQGTRRSHHRRSSDYQGATYSGQPSSGYSTDPMSGQAQQNTSGNDALAQAGMQVVQMLFNKKSDSQSSQ